MAKLIKHKDGEYEEMAKQRNESILNVIQAKTELFANKRTCEVAIETLNSSFYKERLSSVVMIEYLNRIKSLHEVVKHINNLIEIAKGNLGLLSDDQLQLTKKEGA